MKHCNGVIGFRVNNEDYLLYSHFESNRMYDRLIDFIKTVGLENLKSIAERSWMVGKECNDKLSHERCLVNKKKRCDIKYDRMWIEFLENNEIDYDYFYEYSFKYDDTSEFVTCSKFCKYVNIINFDTNKLETYIGKNYTSPENCGRYASLKYEFDSGGYCYGVRLVKETNL